MCSKGLCDISNEQKEVTERYIIPLRQLILHDMDKYIDVRKTEMNNKHR